MATVTEFILTGVAGQSSFVGTLEIFSITPSEALSTAAPKTGCFDSPCAQHAESQRRGVGGDRVVTRRVMNAGGCHTGENQSRKSLCTVFMKNCEPPELGCPVLAIESVPGLFESLAVYSSLMLPP